MTKQELRTLIRQEVQHLIKDDPNIMEEGLGTVLKSGLQSFKSMIAGVMDKLGGKEKIASEIQDKGEKWVNSFYPLVATDPIFKRIALKVQEIAEKMQEPPSPPTGVPTADLQLASILIKGHRLNEGPDFEALEQRLRSKKLQGGLLKWASLVVFVLTYAVDGVMSTADWWWIIICVALMGANAVSQIILKTTLGKMKIPELKTVLAQHAQVQPADIDAYTQARLASLDTSIQKMKSRRG